MIGSLSPDTTSQQDSTGIFLGKSFSFSDNVSKVACQKAPTLHQERLVIYLDGGFSGAMKFVQEYVCEVKW